MKNNYKICGKYTIIFIKKEDKSYEIIIDTEDLEKINIVKNSWRINIIDNNFYIKGSVFKNNEIISISLQKYILGLNTQEHIKFVNKNKLDFRKSNLTTNRDLIQNEYFLKKNGEVEIVLNDYNGNEKARTIIDIDDLEKIIHYKYRWRYSIINNIPCIYSNNDLGEKVYIEHILLNTNNFVKHINNNTLDNRKRNLKILNKKRKHFKKNKNKKPIQLDLIDKNCILNTDNNKINKILLNNDEGLKDNYEDKLLVENRTSKVLDNNENQQKQSHANYNYSEDDFEFNF